MTGLGARVRGLRAARGWTQAQLAEAAGVSRQLVGAVEAGRHLPRVDAAASLARVLGTTVEDLLVTDDDPSPVGVVDEAVPEGLVRIAQVGQRRVVVAAGASGEAMPAADGVVREGRLQLFEPARPTAVVAGCEPALGLTARLLEARSAARAIAVGTSSAGAYQALLAGRVHAAVVHGLDGALAVPPPHVRRLRLASWQVGLAAPRDLPAGWVQDAIAGRVEVVQREAGAQSQAAFERAAAAVGAPAAPLPGTHASGHLDAARRASELGVVAVTIEPTALLLGLTFHPLEAHTSELWIAADHQQVPEVERFVDLLIDTPVTTRLAAVGGYDLTELGVEIAA